MIQTQKEQKLLPILADAINAACSSPDDPVKHVRQDKPLTVRMLSMDKEFVITDDFHTITCLFSKGAIFWFKMEYEKLTFAELKDRYIALNDYIPHSVLTKDKELKLRLNVFGFKVLPEEESKGMKSPSKVPKDITKEKELGPELEMLKKAHLRRALLKKKDLNDLPNLEDILTGGKGATSKSVISPIKDLKEEKEDTKKMKDEEVIIEFKDMEKVEKTIAADVDVLLDMDVNEKEKLKAGSEGEFERRPWLEACSEKVKDKLLVDLLREKGVLDRKTTPSKATPKKGRMPTALKENVEAIVGKSVEEIEKEKEKKEKEEKRKGGKRKKPEGKKSDEEKSEKKAAVEEGGKKGSAAKAKKEGKGYTLRSKEGKKKSK